MPSADNDAYNNLLTMNITSNTASTSPEPPLSPQSSANAWSPQQSTWPSNAAPTTLTQSNPTEQFQNFGHMAAWGDASVSETCMRADLFLWMQPFGSYVNPQEAIASDGSSVVKLEQEENLGFDNGNSTNTWSPLQSHWFNNVTPTTFNQYNPMEQPQNYGQTAAWSINAATPALDLADNPFPEMELQRGHVNLQEGGPFETRDAATASAPPQFSVDTRYPQQFTWPSYAVTPTSIQYSPMEQLQDLRQMRTWSVNSAPAAPDMADTPFGMQPSGSHMNPQEVVPSESRYAAASAPPCSSVDTGSNDVVTPTFTQHNPVEQFQDLGQAAAWGVDSVTVAPYVEVNLLPETQPFNGDMIPLEIGHSKARCAVGVEQKGCLGPGNAKRIQGQRFDKRAVLTLEKHYLKTPYLDRAQKKDLRNQTGLTTKQIDGWFANRRQRDLATVKKSVKKGIRKTWTPYNDDTIFTLEIYYIENPYPSIAEKKDLADQTGLTPKQVGKWFNSRRLRDRHATQKKKPNGITTDAANRHIMDSTSTEDSENVDPMKQPIYVCQASMPKTLTNSNLRPPTASSTQNPSISFQMPLQQFPPQMAVNPIFQQTTALQNPAQPQTTNFYYQ